MTQVPIYRTAVHKYRREYRASIPTNYSATYHLAVINGVTLCGLLLARYAIGDLLLLRYQWPLIALTVLLCNAGEWYTHRYDLHRKQGYTRHANQHHRFFTERMMSYDTLEDGHVIFFPVTEPPRLLILALGLASPVYLLGSAVAAAAVFSTLLCYYWSYEWLHLAYHAPPNSWLGSLPGLSLLREHHRRHHTQSLMGHYNFNITVPLTDWVMGTYYSG
jgi:hypothetical protein